MKKPLCAIVFAFISVFALFSSRPVYAEKTGNGGGAWVCREADGKIRWSNLVDLFEATEEFGLTLAQYPGSTADIVDQALHRISEANPDLSKTLASYLKQLNSLEPNPPQVTYTDNVLVAIDDSLYRMMPSPRRCAGGTVAYEQVINYKEDGLILVAGEVFNSLSNNAKAALVLHEAIYKFRRDTSGDATSVVTRRMVGMILSTMSKEELKKQLESLGELDLASMGMRFVKIPAGTFMMGIPPEEEVAHQPFTKPQLPKDVQHRVILTHPFEMQTTTVTQAQYARIMGVNPSYFQKPENCPNNYEVRQGIPMCPNHPVETINYEDAQKFVAKFDGMRHDGYSYRLPTDAEWEYAARAGTTTHFYFGDEPTQLPHYEWQDTHQTHDVGTLKANPWGLYDMLGNVHQWVSDWYAPMSTDTVTDPSGPASGDYKIVRGCFGFTVSIRGHEYPTIAREWTGIRLVRTAR
jgi:formylglycine-generating enzyme required for sulfatase activity